jgi:hypothetical protein
MRPSPSTQPLPPSQLASTCLLRCMHDTSQLLQGANFGSHPQPGAAQAVDVLALFLITALDSRRFRP